MARRKKEIFAHNNKYEGNIFKKFGRWFRNLEGWKKGLLIAVTVILILGIILTSFVFSKLGKLNRVELGDDELSCVDVDGYINILLLGVDSRDMTNLEGTGGDAIMILSIKEETGDVKLMSVYRDTYLKLGDSQSYGKITDGHRTGGIKTMIQTLNQAMDLNISQFAIVNFKAVADLVDNVGGITVDVQDYEIPQLNKYTIRTANNIGRKDYKLVEKPGEQLIEGVQAVSYGRIRKGVGDDFKRTERMRIVLTKVFEKLKDMSLGSLNSLIDDMLPEVQTNMSNSDILGLAKRLPTFKISGSKGWPYNVTGGMLNGVSYVFPDGLADNTTKLHQEMFGQEDYVPSATVNEISQHIQTVQHGESVKPKPIDQNLLPDDDKEIEDKGDKPSDSDKDKPSKPSKPSENEKPSKPDSDKPAPEPQPEPEPEPQPEPQPEPVPEPEPVPQPEPQPAPASEGNM